MKEITCLGAILVLLVAGAAGQTQQHKRWHAGLEVDFTRYHVDMNFENGIGYRLGAGSMLKANWLQLVASCSYSRASQSVELIPGTYKISTTFNQWLAAVRLSWPSRGKLKFLVEAGPGLALLLTGPISIDAGTGARFEIGRKREVKFAPACAVGLELMVRRNLSGLVLIRQNLLRIEVLKFGEEPIRDWRPYWHAGFGIFWYF